jgi:hypothetical protein
VVLTPSTERVRLEPISLKLPDSVRLGPSSGDAVEIRVRRSRAFILSVFLLLICVAFVVLFVVGQRPVPAVFNASIIATTLVAFAALSFWDGGGGMTRAWRFRRARVSRDGHFPFPSRLFAREFPEVYEFEIVHALFTSGLFKRGLQGGHQDTLRFWAGGRTRPVTVMERALRDSSATLRGGLFIQDHAADIERELLPEVLAVAFLAARKVGVPLYVIEKTSYIGTDSDG